ncbi:hypothetical protein [Streptomyces sp. NPDC058657]|uniref:hypothetical protein n=1 Tax=unclassified Streptomyces TaxID=2593676 RepID=UPI00365DE15B
MSTVVNSITGTVGGMVIQTGNLPSVVSYSTDAAAAKEDVVEISNAERTEIVELLSLFSNLNTRKSERAEELAEELRSR